MAIIIGGNPRAERQEPVALAESKIRDNVEPMEAHEKDVAHSEKPEAEVGSAVKSTVKRSVKRARGNVKRS